MSAFDTVLTSDYAAFVLSPVVMTAPNEQAASKPSSGDYMNIPLPVTKLLLQLAPVIANVRWAAEVLNWSSSRTADSWLVLAGWWGLCLVTDYSVR
jgi:hypothetical protein